MLLGLLGMAGAATLSWTLTGCGNGGASGAVGRGKLIDLGPLMGPDENGLLLPVGFRSRVVARTGEPPVPMAEPWHAEPDGGATFARRDGWVYVSNSEVGRNQGGASALYFAGDGTLLDSYRILQGTSRNCAGGATPWGTWLSCEEHPTGLVWECDPLGRVAARALPALGAFSHEAVAVDPETGSLYLTEDQSDGRLYRYVPARMFDGIPDLDFGRLEVMEALPDGSIQWHALPDPSGTTQATRYQVPASTGFRGGEGIGFLDGSVYFTTKGDNRVWRVDLLGRRLAVVYDAALDGGVLTGVDNVVVAPSAEIVVAEDGGDMQLVALDLAGRVVPIVQVVGHDASEMTGPAFDPSGTRLYFSSQNGSAGTVDGGMTFEVRGRFFV